QDENARAPRDCRACRDRVGIAHGRRTDERAAAGQIDSRVEINADRRADGSYGKFGCRMDDRSPGHTANRTRARTADPPPPPTPDAPGAPRPGSPRPRGARRPVRRPPATRAPARPPAPPSARTAARRPARTADRRPARTAARSPGHTADRGPGHTAD